MNAQPVKTISVLGSTGSIGRSTLDVVRSQPGRFRIAGLAGGGNSSVLAAQVMEFYPEVVSVRDAASQAQLEAILREHSYDLGRTTVLSGDAGAVAVATVPTAEMVVAAMVGFAGINPAYQAILAGKDVALANKEVLVAAGQLITDAVDSRQVRLLPVDSEHNAIFQCLRGENPCCVRRIWLTASGGPFLETPEAAFERITPESALRHPTWKMGPKITIDSATMMNKGLEVIEAHWLFRLPPERIKVIIHPQSTVHSLVEFWDGSILAQLGRPDMKLPIAYALNFPERAETDGVDLDLCTLPALEFREPDFGKFPCLALAYEALAAGGSMPAVLSAANEEAVAAFLSHCVTFPDIPRVIRQTMDRCPVEPVADIEHLKEVDRNAREIARHTINHGPK